MTYANWIEKYVQAGSPDLTAGGLEILSKDSDYKVRVRVAENSATPVHVLQRLLTDEHPDVRLAVASNGCVTMELLMQLTQDQDPTVRFGLAEDAQMPVEILKVLCEDDNPYVVWRVQKTLNRRQAHKPVDSQKRFGNSNGHVCKRQLYA